MPRRVGPDLAHQLTTECLPVGDVEALSMGLVDQLLPRDSDCYDEQLRDLAEHLAGSGWAEAANRKRRRRELDEHATPLGVYRAREQARMASDFASAEYDRRRQEFVGKHRPQNTPLRLARYRRRGTGALPAAPESTGRIDLCQIARCDD